LTGNTAESNGWYDWRVRWKRTLFLLLAVGFGVAAWLYHYWGSVSTTSGLSTIPLESITVLTSNQNIPLHLSVDVTENIAAVYLSSTGNPPANTKILVRMQGLVNADKPFQKFANIDGTSGPDGTFYTAAFVTAGQIKAEARRDKNGFGALIGDFYTPQGSIIRSNDGYAEQLPALMPPSGYDDRNFTAAMVEKSPSGSIEIVNAPTLRSDGLVGPVQVTDLSKYKAIMGTPQKLLYYAENVQTTAVLEAGEDLTSGLQMNVDSPPPASTEGGNFKWRGTSDLFPVIEATSTEAEQSAGNDLFVSGILFATAAAALIAFIQEGEKRFRWFVPKSKERTESSPQAEAPPRDK
jgi:hypothetical protein